MKCSRCNTREARIMPNGNTVWCAHCTRQDSRKHVPLGQAFEWTTDTVKEERKKYRNDLVQPFRQGELSKEFCDLYPDRVKGMIKEQAITQEQVHKAKEVWKGDL